MKITDAQAIVRGLTNTHDEEVHIDVQYLIPLIGIDEVEAQLTAFGELQSAATPRPFGSTRIDKEVKSGMGSFNRTSLLEALRSSDFLKANKILIPS